MEGVYFYIVIPHVMQTSKDITWGRMSHISCNMHPHDLPDISALALGVFTAITYIYIYYVAI